MKTELKKIMPEVLEKQMDATLREIAMHELHLEFQEGQFKGKPTPKDKEEKERTAQQKLQVLTPLKDNIELKTKYYEWLCKKES